MARDGGCAHSVTLCEVTQASNSSKLERLLRVAMAEATPLLAPGDIPTTRERSWSQTAEGQRDSVGGARSSLSEAATQTRRRCGCGVVRVCGVALVALAAVGCGVAVALTRHPHAEPHTNSHHPPPPPIIREGFYVDSAEPPGSLRGARMVTVKKVRPPPPPPPPPPRHPTHRPDPPCCELVVSTRDANEVAVAALYQADIANNDTKNQDDVLIAKADDALEAARATLDQAGLDLSAQHRAINVANNTCKNTRQSYYQWVSLCNTPQPPQVCLDDIQPQDAKDAWGAANRSLAEATDALPGLELRRDAAVAELSGATSDSQAMIRKKAADGQTCDLDITNKIGIKNATARLFDAARRACPGYQCRSPEVPPPPPLEIGTEIAVIGTDDGVAFWSLHGVVTDANRLRLTVDFGPALRSGSRWRNGTFVPGGIKWGASGIHVSTQSTESVSLAVFSVTLP